MSDSKTHFTEHLTAEERIHLSKRDESQRAIALSEVAQMAAHFGVPDDVLEQIVASSREALQADTKPGRLARRAKKARRLIEAIVTRPLLEEIEEDQLATEPVRPILPPITPKTIHDAHRAQHPESVEIRTSREQVVEQLSRVMELSETEEWLLAEFLDHTNFGEMSAAHRAVVDKLINHINQQGDLESGLSPLDNPVFNLEFREKSLLRRLFGQWRTDTQEHQRPQTVARFVDGMVPKLRIEAVKDIYSLLALLTSPQIQD